MSKPRLQQGFTLPEILIAATILSVIIAMSVQYLMGSWNTHSVTELQTYMKSHSEEGLHRLSRHLSQSRRIFGNDGVGPAYLGKLNLTAAPPPIGGTTFPTIRTLGSMSPEKDCERSPSEYFLPNSVGNALFFASVVDTHQFDVANFTLPRSIDIYRFNLVYITDSRDPDTSDSVTYLERDPVPMDFVSNGDPKFAQNLIHWQSVKVADQLQLQDYYDDLVANSLGATRTSVADALAAEGVTVAWQRSSDNPNSNTFYTIGTTLTAQGGGFRLGQFKYEDALRLKSTGSSMYSIAYNTQADTSHPGFFPTGPLMTVPHYYSPTLPGGVTCPQVSPVPTASPAGGDESWAFPRGFEVVIVGPQSGRSVLMHVSMVAKGYAKNLIAQNHSLTTYARDL